MLLSDSFAKVLRRVVPLILRRGFIRTIRLRSTEVEATGKGFIASRGLMITDWLGFPRAEPGVVEPRSFAAAVCGDVFFRSESAASAECESYYFPLCGSEVGVDRHNIRPGTPEFETRISSVSLEGGPDPWGPPGPVRGGLSESGAS